ncbi:hypothetical protein FSP39_011610 [Pinctada imbricata]|uniref:MYND-type domain-containing protein n=1 Tax=Pinctada imbricata TaxID=66713 RepID=A0AA88Y6L7_PINIB|nr:hypothetical protein FSP39_011610 [Pinctada imbricata]
MASKMKVEHVELGFVEEADENDLTSHNFPSKVGGKPAWLSLSNLPSPDQVTCLICGDVMIFLMQVYAPDEEKDVAFHRILYLFICRNPSCCVPNSNNNIVVYRSQLGRYNNFYSSEPPEKSSRTVKGPTAEKYQPLCCVCGSSGPKRCSKCQRRSYCSKKHQVMDWKNGHKATCSKPSNKIIDYFFINDDGIKPSELLFPEFELVTEPENYKDSEKEKSETEKMEELNEFMKSEKAESLLQGVSSEDIEKMANKEEDEVFLYFRKRTQHEPEQVLRYNKGGCPLWVSKENSPSDTDIPKCEECGSDRQFEFQVMPQLLNFLKVDSLEKSIDWGTLCVYTCKDSCDIGSRYSKEFVWKQDFSPNKS